MAEFYLDTSAIVKRYVPEIGSGWVLSICNPASGNGICVAAITKAEFASAVCRRNREGAASTIDRDRLINDFLAHVASQYHVVSITDARLALAIDLMKRHPLRAYDAVQLAAAVALNQSLMDASLPPLTFVSADDRLSAAAAAEGLRCENPNTHP